MRWCVLSNNLALLRQRSRIRLFSRYFMVQGSSANVPTNWEFVVGDGRWSYRGSYNIILKITRPRWELITGERSTAELARPDVIGFWGIISWSASLSGQRRRCRCPEALATMQRWLHHPHHQCWIPSLCAAGRCAGRCWNLEVWVVVLVSS